MQAETLTPEQEWSHRQALLLKHRCSHCAEPLSPQVILQGGQCSHCSNEIFWRGDFDAELLIETVSAKWRRWRWPAVGLMVVGNLIGGWVPLLPSLMLLVALVVIHFALVSRPLRWLSMKRRVATRFTLKLLLATLALVKLAVNILVMPLIGAHVVILAFVSVSAVLVYSIGAQRLIGNRLRRETVTAKLDAWEWMVPAGLAGGLVIVCGIGFGLLALLLYMLAELDVPAVSDVARFILS